MQGKTPGDPAKGNPRVGKSNFVSLTITLTGKIEDKPLNTSRRKRTGTSVWTILGLVLLFFSYWDV